MVAVKTSGRTTKRTLRGFRYEPSMNGVPQSFPCKQLLEIAITIPIPAIEFTVAFSSALSTFFASAVTPSAVESECFYGFANVASTACLHSVRSPSTHGRPPRGPTVRAIRSHPYSGLLLQLLRESWLRTGYPGNTTPSRLPIRHHRRFARHPMR